METQLSKEIGQLLSERGETLSTAESCTGGLIGHRITVIPGSSAYYKGGVISYSNEIKERVLGVRGETLRQYGAVSEAVVKQMAEGVRLLMDTDYGVATSGVAGPGGGTPEKPVGTVWIAVATHEVTTAKCLHLNGDRLNNIRGSAEGVLELIKEVLEVKKR